MTMKIDIESYIYEELMTCEVGDCIEAYDINGIEIYLERVTNRYTANLEIEGKYFLVKYCKPAQVFLRYKGEIYTK